MNKVQTIKALLAKYDEGLTSLHEEQLLRKYFRKGKDIPVEWLAYQAMFQFFAEERTARSVQKNALPKWLSVAAAACLILAVSIQLLTPTRSTETSYAYIDGEKITNLARIQHEALLSLENLSDEEDDIMSSQIEALDLLFE